MNWSLWRSFHLEHHAHTGSDRDPKLKHRLTIRHPAQYAALPIGGLAFLAEFWGQSIGALAGRPPAFVPGSRHRAVRRDGIALIAASTAMVVGLVVAPHLVLVVWVMPLVLTYCVVLPATGMSEHYGCDADGSAFDTTRTVVSNRLFRFLVWNNNFHGVHHLLPAVPFHHAPAVHAYIEPRMRHLSPSYLRFHGEILGATRIRRSTSQLPHVP
jgi:fatty acid desaturase